MNSSFGERTSQTVDGLTSKSSSSQKQYFDVTKQDCDGEDIDDVEGRDKELERNNAKPDQKLVSSATSSDEEDKDFEIALTRIFSESAPLKLISAMKGSREKQGLSPRRLTVSWAPDVYDPPPTIISHTKGKKQQKTKNKDNKKKNGKKGQKGGNSPRGDGGSGRDKKQSRKNSRERFIDSESYCGSSFLKTSLTKVHYSVAEAL